MTLKSERAPAPATMVERMARAAFRTFGDMGITHGDFDKLLPDIQKRFVEAQAAALRELREPTEEMAGATAAAAAMGEYPHRFITAAIDAEIAAYEATR